MGELKTNRSVRDPERVGYTGSTVRTDAGRIAIVPAHDLDEVKLLVLPAARPAFGRRLAIDIVRDLLDLDADEAREAIRALVLGLRPENFAHTLRNQPPPADVYGVEVAGRAWYIKVTIYTTDGRHLLVISCHPPTDPLMTIAGTIRR